MSGREDRAERATIQEQVGRALNSSGLKFAGRTPGAETPLQQIAALGAAGLHVHHGADRRRVAVAALVLNPAHAPDPQDVLAAELSSLLWHLKYAGQDAVIPRAAILFATWLAHRGRFHFVPEAERPSLLHALALRCLHEWLSDRCVACGGSGKEEKSPGGSWVRPMGRMARNAIFRTCAHCHGSRRALASHTQRVSALGINRQRYDDERWDTHCAAGVAWLNFRFAPRLKASLTAQLERSKKRV